MLHHAWSGNKGVIIMILTLLIAILTPRVEIKGSKLCFLDFS
jgi:hypothetical protein